VQEKAIAHPTDSQSARVSARFPSGVWAEFARSRPRSDAAKSFIDKRAVEIARGGPAILALPVRGQSVRKHKRIRAAREEHLGPVRA